MGFLIDTCIWVDVEKGLLAPADVASETGGLRRYSRPGSQCLVGGGALHTAADRTLAVYTLAAYSVGMLFVELTSFVDCRTATSRTNAKI